MCNHSGVSFQRIFLDRPNTATIIDLDDEDDGKQGSAANTEICPEKYRALVRKAKDLRERWKSSKANLHKQAQRLQRHQCEMQELETQMQETKATLCRIERA